MKIYLAGSCGTEQRENMVVVANALRKANYEVYCPFELKIPDAWEMSQEDWAAKVFEKDIEALNACDVMVYITPGRVSTAGSNWEQGYAYALGKKIYVFQYVISKTSLMTYCGCDYFADIVLPSGADKITKILNTKQNTKPRCTSVLT